MPRCRAENPAAYPRGHGDLAECFLLDPAMSDQAERVARDA
jgi:hypothetical protein